MPRKRHRRAAGEGSIYYRADRDTWVAAIVIGFDEHGRPLRRTKTTRAKAEAMAWLTAQQAVLNSGLKLGENATLQEVVDEWMAAGQALRGWGTSTVTSYRATIAKILPRLGRMRARDLDPALIERTLLDLTRSGASPAMVARVRSHLAMALRYALRKRLIERDPMLGVDAPTTPAPQIQRWSEAEAGRIVRECLDRDDQTARYVLVALGTGLRTEELLGLAWSSVDLEERILLVERVAIEVAGRKELRAGGKTEAANRPVPIDELTAAALARQAEHVEHLRGARAHLDAKRVAEGLQPLGWADLGLVFPTSLGTVVSRKTLRAGFDDLQERTGVTRIKLYATRSTHGSLLADAGVNLHALAERMGHADRRYLAKKYLRGSTSAHRAVAEQIGQILGSTLVAGASPESVSEGQEPAGEGARNMREVRREASN